MRSVMVLMIIGITTAVAVGRDDGSSEQAALLSLWESSRSSNRQTRYSAILKMEKFGSLAVPLLMEIWHRGDPSDANAAAVAIHGLKPTSKAFSAKLHQDLLA